LPRRRGQFQSTFRACRCRPLNALRSLSVRRQDGGCTAQDRSRSTDSCLTRCHALGASRRRPLGGHLRTLAEHWPNRATRSLTCSPRPPPLPVAAKPGAAAGLTGHRSFISARCPRHDLPSQPRAYPRRDNVQDPSTVKPTRPKRQPTSRPLSTPCGGFPPVTGTTRPAKGASRWARLSSSRAGRASRRRAGTR
jgi:hypothetical protein